MRQNHSVNKHQNLYRAGACCALLAALTGMLPAQAAWLSVCDDQAAEVLTQPAAGYRAHAWRAQGERLTLLQITAAPVTLANCSQRELALGNARVGWAALVPPMPEDVRQLILQGQEQPGRFDVSEVILPSVDAAPAASSRAAPPASRQAAPGRAAWFWSPARWLETPQQIFNGQKLYGLRRVYITVPVEQEAVRNAEALNEFIREAHARGLEVWAVLGDPAAVLPQGMQNFAAMARAYAAFNQSSAVKLDGLQLDIEPYLLPGYQLAPRDWQRRYAEAVRFIHAAAPTLALDLALPFWWGDEASGGQAFLSTLASSISSLTVMDYRTDAEQIVRLAQPFLAWGQQHGKKVSIALEALSIPDEGRRHFERATRGELWHVTLAGREVLFLLDQPVSLAQASGFRYTRSSRFEGSSVSFFGRTDQLMRLLPSLEAQLQRWPSFSGMALHGLE
jgi:hypothetical protein